MDATEESDNLNLNSDNSSVLQETTKENVEKFNEETNFDEDVVFDQLENEIDDSEVIVEQETVPVDDSENDENTTEKAERLTKLPVARIRNIMKFDDDVNYASQEAIFLVTKATEMFIKVFVEEAYQSTLMNKKKTLSKRDVDVASVNEDRFIFLDGSLD